MPVFNARSFLTVVMLGLCGCLLRSAAAQSRQTESLRTDSPRAEFASELERLAGICDGLNLVYPAKLSRSWLRPERADQSTLYLPLFQPDTKLAKDDPSTTKWLEYFTTARQNYARALFAQAQSLAAQGEEESAFRLVWQVLREDPEHAEARRVLGNLVNPLKSSARLRNGTAPQNQLGWPARSYSLSTTLHFNVYSRADRKTSIQFANQLEKIFALWSQYFYPLWAPPGKLSRALDQPGEQKEFWSNRNKFEVVLLKDRSEYLKLLGASESNIGVSVGYYSPLAEKAFFYPSESLDETLTHELTHQFLAEGTRLPVRQDMGSGGSYWMLEGIAMYFESLTERDTCWTIGGWESVRMQTARYRGVRDGYWPAWQTYASGSMQQWKTNPEVTQLYTHSAGLTHTLLDGRISADARQKFIATLAKLYQAELETLPLLKLLGSNESAAKAAYQDALTVSDADVLALDQAGSSIRELVFSGSQLSPNSWQRLAKQADVRWLDLAFSNISTDQLSHWLDAATQLERLSIEGTQVNASILSQVNSLGQLEELDLSDCQVSNADLQALSGNATIQTLWLANTQVTPACLKTLRSMTALTNCNVAGF